jgi:hypothetical protein
MDFGRAFTYAFEDPDWLKKVGIAALVFLIPVVGAIIVMGWALEITRRVINDDPQPLPGWDDFGGFLGKGFKAFVVSFAYALPIILIVGCGQLVTFGAAAALSEAEPDLAATVAMIVSVCMGCFALIFGILAGLMVPPAYGNLAATGELGAAFRFGEVFGMLRAAIGPYLLSLVIVAVAAMVLSPIGGLVCGIGALATSAYLQVLSGHLYGQAYKIAKATVAPAM